MTYYSSSICINETVTFSIVNPSNIASYTWDFGDGNSATGDPVSHIYRKIGTLFPTLILNDSSGFCIIPVQDTIVIEDVKAIFTSSDTLGCEIPLAIDFTNQSIGADQYSWNIDGVLYNNTNPTHTFAQYGSFLAELFIESNSGCFDTSRQQIRISPKPQLVLSQDTGICIGDTIILEASGGNTYTWNPLQSLNFIAANKAQAFPQINTVYNVVTSNSFNCQDSGSINVEVIQEPTSYSLMDSSLIIGESIYANVFVGPQYKYFWSPPEGLSCTDCPNPIIQPLHSTVYTVQIFNDYACFNFSDTIRIDVEEKYSLDVPQAFSPNGDGNNDFIFVKGWGIKELVSFSIFNRFGEKVFESTDIEQGWDGNFKGDAQGIETYIYTVEVIYYNGETARKKGNINLIR